MLPRPRWKLRFFLFSVSRECLQTTPPPLRQLNGQPAPTLLMAANALFIRHWRIHSRTESWEKTLYKRGYYWFCCSLKYMFSFQERRCRTENATSKSSLGEAFKRSQRIRRKKNLNSSIVTNLLVSQLRFSACCLDKWRCQCIWPHPWPPAERGEWQPRAARTLGEAEQMGMRVWTLLRWDQQGQKHLS